MNLPARKRSEQLFLKIPHVERFLRGIYRLNVGPTESGVVLVNARNLAKLVVRSMTLLNEDKMISTELFDFLEEGEHD